VQTVTELFHQRKRFVVPLFQRTYVWSEDDQWIPLWEDLERQARAFLDLAAAVASPAEPSHFLGAIVVQNAPALGGGAPPTGSIIDGQQRLVTFQILLAAIRDKLRELNHSYVDTFEQLTRNAMPHMREEDAFKVWPTNSDRPSFSQAISIGSLKQLRETFGGVNNQLPVLIRAYKFFAEEFERFISEEWDDAPASKDQRISAVYSVLSAAFRFVVIELDSHEDPQIIFESLNARGEPLLPSDLIKNHLFLEADDDQALRWYPEYWAHFDTEITGNGAERFWRSERPLMRAKRPLIDIFFYMFLLESGDRTDVNAAHLYQEFKSWRIRTRSAQPIEEVLARIRGRSELFAGIINGTLGTRVSRLFDSVLAFDSFVAMPLILHVLAREVPEADKNAALDAIESFLVRRWFCKKPTNGLAAIFSQTLQHLLVQANSELAPTIRERLEGSQTQGHPNWPSDNDFRTAWRTKQLYYQTRIERARLALSLLERELRGGESVDGQLSVEHVLPQKANEHVYPYSVPHATPQQNMERRAQLTDTIGNLSLLESRLNPRAGNRAFAEKRSLYAQNSHVHLNQYFQAHHIWGEIEIEARSDSLFELACRIWPGPGV